MQADWNFEPEDLEAAGWLRWVSLQAELSGEEFASLLQWRDELRSSQAVPSLPGRVAPLGDWVAGVDSNKFNHFVFGFTI